jgi:hypothetical protein
MADRDGKKTPEEALDDLKMDVADDVDVPLEENGDNGDLTARQLGKVGGQMVRRLVQRGEEALAEDESQGQE